MTGSRERNKAKKRQRIRLAALKLFSELGYEATTLRDVAREAQVALGTLSLYATDKRDLSLLVFNERISAVTTRATAASWKKKQACLLARLMAFFGTYYRDFNRNHTLARIFLQLNYYSSGMHGADYNALRLKVAACIEAMVKHARATGEIADDEAPDLVARHFFFVFSAAVRWWIADPKPDLQAGLNELERLFRIQIAGLRPRREPVAATSRNNGATRPAFHVARR